MSTASTLDLNSVTVDFALTRIANNLVDANLIPLEGTPRTTSVRRNESHTTTELLDSDGYHVHLWSHARSDAYDALLRSTDQVDLKPTLEELHRCSPRLEKSIVDRIFLNAASEEPTRAIDEGDYETILLMVMKRVHPLASLYVAHRMRAEAEHADLEQFWSQHSLFFRTRVKPQQRDGRSICDIVVCDTTTDQGREPGICATAVKDLERLFKKRKDGRHQCMVLNEMVTQEPRTFKQLRSGFIPVWEKDVVSILAQTTGYVKTMYSAAGALSTLLGFHRLFIVDGSGSQVDVQISSNLLNPDEYRNEHRQDPEKIKQVVKVIFISQVICVVRDINARKMGKGLPADLRVWLVSNQPARHLGSPLRLLTSFKAWRNRWSALFWEWVLVYSWFWLWFAGWLVVFSKSGQQRWAKKSTPFRLIQIVLYFDVLSESSAGLVLVNRRAHLVIKISYDRKSHNREREAYKKLQAVPLRFVPRYLGELVTGTSCRALLLSFEGVPLEGPLSESDWRHLEDLVGCLHAAGVHHHDIRRANLVRGQDGCISLIDFNLSPELCPEGLGCPDLDCINDEYLAD